MAIVKNISRVSRLDGEFSPGFRDGVYGEDGDDEVQSQSVEFDGTDVSEVDSGMGSDDYDLLELGEAGSECCQLGNQSCLIPFELYDLPDLSLVLSVDTWNNCLMEEERFALAEYLPDMDQETFSLTLTELFSGNSFHFGSPVAELFNRLKGGLCEPRVDLYRRCLNCFQRHEHYHQIRKYQDSMVDSLFRMRDAWENYAGCGIEERLRLLSILRSRRPLGYLKNGDWGSETDSENDEAASCFQKKRLKMDQRTMYPMKPSLDVAQGQNKHRKEHPRGILKVADMNVSSKSKYPETEAKPLLLRHELKTKHKPSGPPSTLPRQDPTGFGLGSIKTNRHLMGDVDNGTEEHLYGMTVQYKSKAAHGSLVKWGKKLEPLKRDGRHAFANKDQEAMHHFARSKDANYLSLDASCDQHPFDSPKKDARAELNNPKKDCLHVLMLKGDLIGRLAGRKSYHHHQVHDARYGMDLDGSIKRKKWKNEPDLKVNDYYAIHSQMGGFNSHSDHRTRTSLSKTRGKSSQNGGEDVEYIRSSSVFAQSEETESESSDQQVEVGDINPLNKKLRPRSCAPEDFQSETVKTVHGSRKVKKFMKKVKKGQNQYPGQDSVPCTDTLSSKGEDKFKSSGTGLQGYASESLSASAKVSSDQKLNYKKMKGKVHDKHRDGLEFPLSKVYSAGGKRKAVVDLHYTMSQADYGQDNATSLLEDKGEEDLDDSCTLMYEEVCGNKSVNRGQVSKGSEFDHHEKINRIIIGCSNSVTKRQKGKVEERHFDGLEETDCVQCSPKRQIDDLAVVKKMKKRENSGPGSLSLVTRDPIMLEKEQWDTEPELLPPRNPFTLITPTVYTGFSFSIIHLLSAIRKAMITINAEEAIEMLSHPEKNDGRQRLAGESGVSASQSNEKSEGGSLDGQEDLPSLTVLEIVNRVRTNPGDPFILETQEPLEDLVRGVLKIFSSKTAPLGAKGWKALVLYEKSAKSWTWIGPVSSGLSNHETAEDETSSEAWGIPHKLLVKLVDAFANWLISIQETLKQIGSLPAPPVMMLPNMEEKERFKDLRAQKSLVTISRSSDEVMAYFRREEYLRYSIPDRAFSYTAIDGRKSIVAPLRRGSGKPTSKARDHFMLKTDRPPHVTVLCLVRDAAARLPGSIGTRADVCTLIRDSQYLVEDVSDAQVNSVVSGALDRLHYEQDPCVQFDADRKLWVYLHRDREEEDFEDYGTSSTKKWRRPRRDAGEHADMRQVTDEGYPEIGDQDAVGSLSGYEFRSDTNVNHSSPHTKKKTKLINNDFRHSLEDVGQLIDSRENNMHQGHPMGWDVLGGNRILCQENSTNEDFDDEASMRERHVKLINASLL